MTRALLQSLDDRLDDLLEGDGGGKLVLAQDGVALIATMKQDIKAVLAKPEQPNPYDACESFKAYSLALKREAVLTAEVGRLTDLLAKPERKPMVNADREQCFLQAEKAIYADANLSWRNAIVNEVEAFHNIKE
jgi:hypothetical protein